MYIVYMGPYALHVWLRWGPCTQYDVDLLGIDSAGGGANDVMELIGKSNEG